ncbi:MAG: hypothetical protein H6621_12105 [Halobacteriovoraceae bacterium]|nr:hypothetical protein [Halobacteriovoraceae bacterium]MCB9095803.1 hypothetical protein [Halobacteriovoraceae bacterium]
MKKVIVFLSVFSLFLAGCSSTRYGNRNPANVGTTGLTAALKKFLKESLHVADNSADEVDNFFKALIKGSGKTADELGLPRRETSEKFSLDDINSTSAKHILDEILKADLKVGAFNFKAKEADIVSISEIAANKLAIYRNASKSADKGRKVFSKAGYTSTQRQIVADYLNKNELPDATKKKIRDEVAAFLNTKGSYYDDLKNATGERRAALESLLEEAIATQIITKGEHSLLSSTGCKNLDAERLGVLDEILTNFNELIKEAGGSVDDETFVKKFQEAYTRVVLNKELDELRGEELEMADNAFRWACKGLKVKKTTDGSSCNIVKIPAGYCE